jgi:PIN domain nuclease of toxin-antitoxin system
MPRHDHVLLDTHALLWWQAGGARLSTAARATIDGAITCLVSPVTCWEVAMLVTKDRVGLDRPVQQWIHDLLAGPQVDLAELTAAVAVEAGSYRDMHGDPADRLLYATARALGVPMVTKDSSIREFAAEHRGVPVVW